MSLLSPDWTESLRPRVFRNAQPDVLLLLLLLLLLLSLPDFHILLIGAGVFFVMLRFGLRLIAYRNLHVHLLRDADLYLVRF